MKNLTGVFVAIFGMAVAVGMAAGASADVIEACSHDKTGKIRVAPEDQPGCLPSETPITLNTSAPSGYVQSNTVSLHLLPGEFTAPGEVAVACDPGDYVTGCSYSQNSYSVALENIHVFAVAANGCGVDGSCWGCQVHMKNISPTETEEPQVTAFAFCADVAP